MKEINLKTGEYLIHFDAIFHKLLLKSEIPAARIKNALFYSLFPGGKRLRPLLVYLCGEINHLSMEVRDIIAVAVELMHSYSLVHDDLPAMDDDDLRRNQPSCHKAFDEASAILVGDGMQALAIDLLLSYLPDLLPAIKVIKVTQELVHASGPAGMVSGQALDLAAVDDLDISKEQLSFIHQLKTGKLISACINMVLAASIESSTTDEILVDFAKQLGLAFQMQDDYIDSYGPCDLLGKGRSSDFANKKLTFTSFYEKEVLAAIIDERFHSIKELLETLGQSATNLLALTDFLSKRHI